MTWEERAKKLLAKNKRWKVTGKALLTVPVHPWQPKKKRKKSAR